MSAPTAEGGAGGVWLAHAALDTLMPMHMVIGPEGQVHHMGPTLAKIVAQAEGGARPALPRSFEACLVVHHPQGIGDVRRLVRGAGDTLELSLRAAPDLRLKGVATAIGPEVGENAGGAPEGGVLLNLSFGLSLVEGTQRFGLTLSDFTGPDLAAEMLYLIEAKNALFEESRRLNRALEGARAQALAQALTDTLTGLANRRGLELELEKALAQGRPFALAVVDLDYFKTVNDAHGHAAGDHVLRQVARVLTEETRRGDRVARVGGDEFVILFADIADGALPLRIAGRIITRLQVPILFEGVPCRVSASIGMALSADYAPPDAPQMLLDADKALYAAKAAGRGRAVMFGATPPPEPGPES